MDEKLVVGRGVVRNDSIRSYIGDRGHVAIVDENVQSRYPELLDGIKTIVVPGGERSKTLRKYEEVIEIMENERLTRRDVVVAVGGGTITDLAGFVASTYKRGIGLILVPTTLLGMCDAAIGGKNALNTENAKNVIGTFYHPELVLVDPIFLATLNDRVLLDGMGEMFKYAVGFDRSMLPRMERLAPMLAKHASFQGAWDDDVSENLLHLVKQAVSIKQNVVLSDFKESGLRKTLNLGHTLAHAIESASEYRISHGEAVAMGTLMVVAWAHRTCALSSDEFGQVMSCYQSLGFPKLRNAELEWEKVLQGMGTDKKMIDHSQLDAVVLERLGTASLRRLSVEEFGSEMMKSLSDLLSHEIAREISPLTMDVKEYLADFKRLLDQRAGNALQQKEMESQQIDSPEFSQRLQVESLERGLHIDIPASKSYTHRYLILAAFADTPTVIRGVTLSDDIEATISALRVMTNATFEISQEESNRERREETEYVDVEAALCVFTVRVVPEREAFDIPEHVVINCRESASTARFLVPFSGIAQMRAGKEMDVVSSFFRGAGSLQRRPMGEILNVLRAQGILEAESDKLPFTVKGWIRPGLFRLSGGMSSQFLSGLLMATPLLGERSMIEVAGKQVSAPYVNMTLAAMRDMGVRIDAEPRSGGGMVYHISPGSYAAREATIHVEKDYSQAAFWLVAEVLRREYEIKGIRTGLPELIIQGMNPDSLQSDRQILSILGIALGEEGNVVQVAEPATVVDLSDAPDLLPIVATYFAVSGRVGKIVGAERNRIKESDRIGATVSELRVLGFKVSETLDGIEVWPSGIQGRDRTVQSHGDHRIAMSLGIVSLFVPDVTIIGKEAINKSYPAFFVQLDQIIASRKNL